MYLKEIKISGFKSFADKTNITLDDNITCIVGPNGSGKSNIIDAVKWVLGEQSIKSLRGSNNMSDVIFAGSKSRSPLNLASVSLVFDNSDSYLKVPYTEISVTRKVFRSGENEYYLNNEKCRLKDIYDLFLDSGMGKYAFNIISQGEVSKIISDSPYERRTIFEEAAGVLKYKRRKEEALKKLEKTNENLTRVKDIIKELEEQIEPLKIQSEQASKYLKIKENLEQIEIALIANDLEKLNVLYHEQTKQIEDLTNEIIEKTTNITNDDIELEKKKQEFEKITTNLTSLQQNLLILTKEEVPHAVTCIVENMEFKKDKCYINACIVVDRDNLKGIIIGKNGQMLKKVGTMAREEIEVLLGKKVYLELFVKVIENWRQKPNLFEELGISEEDD